MEVMCPFYAVVPPSPRSFPKQRILIGPRKAPFGEENKDLEDLNMLRTHEYSIQYT